MPTQNCGHGTRRYTGTAKSEPGWFWSDSQMLVSNQVDDKYSVTGYLGADESGPGADSLPKNGFTWKVSDRTHRVALGATVKAEYATGAVTVTATAGVPAAKSVKLHVNIVSGPPLVITEAAVWTDIARMREIYAQVAIRVDVVDNKISTVASPQGVNLMNGLDAYTSLDVNGKYAMTNEEKALLGAAALRTPTDANGKDDIEVYYVNSFDPFTRGESFPMSLVPDAKYADSVILGLNHPYIVLPHEVGHVLLNDGNHYQPNALARSLDRVNLMVVGDRALVSGTSVSDSRRLTPGQQTTMYTARPNLMFDS